MVDHKDESAVSIRELIAAAGAVACDFAENASDGGRLARLALIEFLRNTPKAVNLDSDFPAPTTGRQALH